MLDSAPSLLADRQISGAPLSLLVTSSLCGRSHLCSLFPCTLTDRQLSCCSCPWSTKGSRLCCAAPCSTVSSASYIKTRKDKERLWPPFCLPLLMASHSVLMYRKENLSKLVFKSFLVFYPKALCNLGASLLWMEWS